VALSRRKSHPRALDALRNDEAFQVAAESRAYLHGRGIDLSGEQVTKTRKALEFFSKGMKAGA
jgi:hypothetical protein